MKFRLIPILFLALLSLNVFSQNTSAKKKQSKPKALKQTEKNFTISGSVKQTFSHCGGAAITEDMMKHAAEPSPYGGKKFYVRKGNVNTTVAPIVTSFTTDNEGKFSFTLPPGIYSIIVEEQLNTISLSDFGKDIMVDKDCLKKWWTEPYHLLDVKNENISGLDFVINHRCFVPKDLPCLNYTGPMPP